MDRPVVIPVPWDQGGLTTAAHLALRAEGVHHELLTLPAHPDAYGQLLAHLWQQGQGFTLVEHDVAPWPGALAELWRCPERWCGFDYPLAHGVLDGGLGCVHFSTELVRDRPEAHLAWEGTPWNGLDLAVREALTGDHRRKYHVHTPAVAHCRRRQD